MKDDAVYLRHILEAIAHASRLREVETTQDHDQMPEET